MDEVVHGTGSADAHRRRAAAGCAATFVVGILAAVAGYHLVRGAVRDVIASLSLPDRLGAQELLRRIAPGARVPEGWNAFAFGAEHPTVLLWIGDFGTAMLVQIEPATQPHAAQPDADAAVEPLTLLVGGRPVRFRRWLHDWEAAEARVVLEAVVPTSGGRRLRLRLQAARSSPEWRTMVSFLQLIELPDGPR